MNKSFWNNLVYFYAQEGFDFKKLGTLDKVAMKIYFHMLEKSAAENPRDGVALSNMRGGFDGTNKAYLAPLLSYVRENQLPQPSRVN